MAEVAAVFARRRSSHCFEPNRVPRRPPRSSLEAPVSSVNFAELRSKISDWAVPEMRLREFIRALNFSVLPFDEDLAYEAGRLRETTRSFGFSLGDRACIATAMGYRVPAISADRSWSRAPLEIEVVLIR